MSAPSSPDVDNSHLHQFPYGPGHPYNDEGLRIAATASPLPNITRAHLPGYNNYTPPLLHFGWSFETTALVQWAAENGINTTMRYQSGPHAPVEEEPNSQTAVTKPEVLQILATKAGTPGLRLQFKMGMRSKGHFLLTISSNYRFAKDTKRITPDQINTLDQYLKKYGIVQDSPAWHLDYELFKWTRIY